MMTCFLIANPKVFTDAAIYNAVFITLPVAIFLVVPLVFTVTGGENLHDLAIRTLGKIPGNEKEKFSALASLVTAGKNRDSSIAVLQTISSKDWDKAKVRPLVDSLVSYLGKLPAADRKSDSAVAAFFLAVSLTEALPAADAKAIQGKLRNLDAK